MPYITPRNKAVTKIQSNVRGHIARKSLDTKLERKRAVEAAAREAGLTGYEFSPKRFPDVSFTEAGSLGLALVENSDSLTQVVRINPGTQAERHPELRPGLVILVVGDVSVAGMPHRQVVQLLGRPARPIALQFIAQETKQLPPPQRPSACNESIEVAVDVGLLPDINSSGPMGDRAPQPHARSGRRPRVPMPRPPMRAAAPKHSGSHAYTALPKPSHTGARSRYCWAALVLASLALLFWLMWKIRDLEEQEETLELENAELQSEVTEEMRRIDALALQSGGTNSSSSSGGGGGLAVAAGVPAGGQGGAATVAGEPAGGRRRQL
jgi:hypothetical protein